MAIAREPFEWTFGGVEIDASSLVMEPSRPLDR